MYSDSELGVMTPETTTFFIRGATNEPVSAVDGRITGLFKEYDSDADGKLQRVEFLRFYFEACRDRGDRVIDNLKNHFIRNDLMKSSDVVEHFLFPKEKMPRFTLSENQKQFDTLFGLLNKPEISS
jgi:hypothetical protein